MFERWQSVSTERDIRNQLNALAVNTYADRKSHSLETAIDFYLDIPDGWSVSSSPSLIYSEMGFCSSASVSIVDPVGRARIYDVTSPDCRLIERNR